MEVLWAPWRMEYILNHPKEEGCIFCAALGGNAEAKGVLFTGAHTLVMMNKFPYINGHLLVAPKSHKADLKSLTAGEQTALMKMISRSLEILKQVMKAEGFNVGLNLGKVAGAGVEDHLHFHIVPRWMGDTNFMTVFGDIRVIPEHMEQTYRRLLPHFREVREEGDADI